ncbi:MAG: hypothetical protein HQL17_05765 [Candidatus Omnitrophica bacterium]|nr:hypothetical protein [Candidatus Omnitrophota bacterium]
MLNFFLLFLLMAGSMDSSIADINLKSPEDSSLTLVIKQDEINPDRVTCYIKNISSKPLLINSKFVVGVDLKFVIIDSNGKSVGLEKLVYPSAPDYQYLSLLNSDADIVTSFSLSDYYKIKPLEVYSVQAIYEPYNGERDEKVWSGSIKSNQIKLQAFR